MSLGKDLCVGGKYQVGKKISSGADEYVFLGKDNSSGEDVAIKLEFLDNDPLEVENESQIYKTLGDGVGIPSVYWSGKEGDYNVLVLELLGPSLRELQNFCGGRFSLKTVLLLAEQMISRIEYVHSLGILHCGIKPGNFCMGVGETGNLVHIIDFGRSKAFRDSETQEHIPFLENQEFSWNLTWASINAHLGIEQSRRDDLERLAYTFIYFLRGSLPWQSISSSSRRKAEKRFKDKKIGTPTDELCLGLPDEFGTFLNYSRSLRFNETPDYIYVRRLFRDLYQRQHYDCGCFDWFLVKPVHHLCRPDS